MKISFYTLALILGCSFAASAQAEPATTKTSKATQSNGASAGKKAGSGPVLRRSSRMEFDGRLVKGERASGAVYLFQRVPRRLPPLLRLKRDQLDRIVLPVLKRGADPLPSMVAEGDAAKTQAASDKDRGFGAKEKGARKAKKGKKVRKKKRRDRKRRKRKKKRRTKASK